MKDKSIWEMAPVTVGVAENGAVNVITGPWEARPFSGEGLSHEIVCKHREGGVPLVASVVFLNSRLEPGAAVAAYVLVALAEELNGPNNDSFDEEQDGDSEGDWKNRTYNRMLEKSLKAVTVSE